MTPLSRPAPAAWLGRLQNAARTLLSATWHAACSLFVASGCFYLGPTPTIEENVPPVVFAKTVETNEPIEIGEAGRQVYVIAEDENADPILFTWTLSEYGYIGNATPVPYDAEKGAGSQVRLDWDENLDGQILTCFVDDGVNDPLVLQWPLEVYL